MIAIKDLEFHYPTGDFSLSIGALNLARNEKTAVIGPSGTGKTTLLNLIAGIMTPDRGLINIAGTDVGRLNDKARRRFRITTIGFVFQDFELLDPAFDTENRDSRARDAEAEVLRPEDS